MTPPYAAGDSPAPRPWWQDLPPELAHLYEPARFEHALYFSRDAAEVRGSLDRHPDWLNGFWAGEPEAMPWVVPLEAAAFSGAVEVVR